MKLFLIGLCLACLVIIGAKPIDCLEVTYENVSYGYEGDPYDGILGADETLMWTLEGTLVSGEQHTYTYLPSSASRWISVPTYTRQGNRTLLVEIDVLVHTSIGDFTMYASGIGEACLKVPGYRPHTADWEVRITNVGKRTAKHISVIGYNRNDFGYECE